MSEFRIIDRNGELVADADGLAGVNEIVRRAPTGATMSTRFPWTRSHRGTRPGAGAAPYAMKTVA